MVKAVEEMMEQAGLWNFGAFKYAQ
jgi:hypothetical protein